MDIGGAEILVYHLVQEQRNQGHQVSIYCLLEGGALAAKLIKKNFSIRICSKKSKSGKILQLYRWFKQDRIEVSHAHNAGATIYAAPPARFAGVRVNISTRHGLVLPPYRIKQELLYSLAVGYSRSKIVGVCEATSQNLRGIISLRQKNIHTIYNGTIPAATSGEDLSVYKNGFTFLTVGRLALPKDHLGLIRAFAKSYDKRKNIRLWIVGDGILRPRLETLVSDLGLEDAIRFWGARDNVGDFLKVADVFTLISTSEGLPISQLEAMASGLSAIVSNVGAMPEIINMGGGGGWVVPVGNADELSRCLLESIDRPDLRVNYGKNANDSYLKYFQLKKMASAYEVLISE